MKYILAFAAVLLLLVDAQGRGCRSCGKGRMMQRSSGGRAVVAQKSVVKTRSACAGGKCAR